MIFVIGTGPIAQEYSRILNHLKQEFVVIGRGLKTADEFLLKTGVKPTFGGVEVFLEKKKLSVNDMAIVATDVENLMGVVKKLLETGVGRILIEKPAAKSLKELFENETILLKHKERLFVAYNRRLYSSAQNTMKMLQEDGGLLSMHFEFTEWSNKIENLKKSEIVKENWFFANSTHVIDLAFFMAGKPEYMSCFSQTGGLRWHDKTKFSGAGYTKNGVIFSYNANWETAGRWGVELMSEKRRYILSPLEKIFIQERDSLEIKEIVNINYDKDIIFKPGFLSQVQAFIKMDKKSLCSIEEHIYNAKHIYNKILNG